MAGRTTKTLCFLLLELIPVIGGMSVYSQDCFADRYCFSLIFNQGGSGGGSSLTDAQNSCRNIRSKLAEINSNQIQNYVTEFLKNATFLVNGLTQKNVLINAQRYDNETWSWVNGEPLAGDITVNASHNVARIWRSNDSSVIESASPTAANGYICEYPNAIASLHNCTFKYKGRCFVIVNSNENWFSARNICLPNGDLASLDWIANATYSNSLNDSVWFNQTTKYWIGLRKSPWIWEGSKSEVKYTYWKRDINPFNAPHRCIGLSYNSTPMGQWMTTDCNLTSQLHYLCLYEKRNKTAVSTKTGTMETATHANSATPTNTLALGLGVGLGLCVALLIIVVVILVVIIIRKRLLTICNTSSQSSPSSANKAKAKPNSGIPYYTQVQKHKREDESISGDNSPPAAESAATSESQITYAEVSRRQTDSSPVANGDHPEQQPVYINFDIVQ